MSDSTSRENPLPQKALSKVPYTDEDAYFAEQERINLELLKKEREARGEDERRCLRPACNGQVMDRVMVDSVEIDRCPTCGGIWLDAGELEILMKRAKGSKNGLMRFFYHLAGRYEE